MYMKNSNLLFVMAVAAATLVSCGKATSYTIDGTVTDSTMNGQMIYLTDMASHDVLDSAVIADGKFSFTGKADTAIVAHIQSRPYRMELILENGHIVAEMGETDKLSGTPLNEALVAFQNDRESLENKIMAKQQELMQKGLSEDEIMDEWETFQETVLMPEHNQLHAKHFDKNRDNAVGAWVVASWGLDPAQLDSVLNLAGENPKANPLGKALVKQMEVMKKTAEGVMFTDFTIEQPDGRQVSLSDYVGKGDYVLVDFWASWCGPCRREIPNIKELYDKYHGKGFEVLGVAVWDKPEDTQKAIEELGIEWPQIINAQQIPTDLYGIEGIPHIILFAPDGTIVARDLRDEAMKEKVAEVMKTVK